jgi:hypothetical protein
MLASCGAARQRQASLRTGDIGLVRGTCMQAWAKKGAGKGTLAQPLEENVLDHLYPTFSQHAVKRHVSWSRFLIPAALEWVEWSQSTEMERAGLWVIAT